MNMNMNDTNTVCLEMSCFQRCGCGFIFVGIHVLLFQYMAEAERLGDEVKQENKRSIKKAKSKEVLKVVREGKGYL